MPSSVHIIRGGTRMYKIYGASGNPAGWIEPSYRRGAPWRLSLFGRPIEDFRYLEDAKQEARTVGFRY